MNNFLFFLAKAHQSHEGWYVGSKSYRNNNPGNLRDPKTGVFIYFPTYDAGLHALEADLTAKITGTAGTIRNLCFGAGKTYDQLVMQDYVSIYAPWADGNDPVSYCDKLCNELSLFKIHPGTPLSVLASLIRGTIDAVPEPPAPAMTLEQRKVSAENALRWASPPRANMLNRLLARINRHLAVS